MPSVGQLLVGTLSACSLSQRVGISGGASPPGVSSDLVGDQTFLLRTCDVCGHGRDRRLHDLTGGVDE